MAMFCQSDARYFIYVIRSPMKSHTLRKNLTLSLIATITALSGSASVAAAASNRWQMDYISPFLYTASNASPSSLYTGFGLQGIKGGDSSGNFLVVGTTTINGVTQGAVYDGPINHGFKGWGSGSGTWTIMNVPTGFGASSTSIYGVDNLGSGSVNLVGSYVGSGGTRLGFYYSGPLTSTPSSSDFQSYQARNFATGKLATFTYIHSISGGLAVGNYDNLGDGSPAGNAFIYSPGSNSQIDIVYPDADKTHTAYGIWYNGGTSYTVAGGVGLPSRTDSGYGEPLGKAYLMDYDSAISGPAAFSHYQTFNYKPTGALRKKLKNKDVISHFEGIWSNGTGLYRLPATVTATALGGLGYGLVAEVRRKSNGKFARQARWSTINAPGASFSTNDSLSGDTSVGLVVYPALNGAPEIISDYAVTPIQQ